MRNTRMIMMLAAMEARHTWTNILISMSNGFHLTNTNGPLQESDLLQNKRANPIADPNTGFSIPPGEQRVINYIAAVDFLQIGFTAAGSEGNYLVESNTRDE